MTALRGLAFLALILVPLASASAAGVSGGSYTIVDGKEAGLDVHVGSSGKASILDRKSDLHAVSADDDCDEPHLHGTIDGIDEPVGGCGWGRILILSKATALVRATANAITEEERAIAPTEPETDKKPKLKPQPRPLPGTAMQPPPPEGAAG